MTELLHADAIVTLAAGSTPEGGAGPESMQRVDAAVALYDQGIADTIVMSGAHAAFRRADPSHPPLASAMRAYALERYPHVPPEAVLAQTESLDTIGDAYFTKVGFAEPRGWRQLVVVTTGEPDARRSHVTRSKAVFTHVMGPSYGIEAVSAGLFPERRTSRLHEAAGDLLMRAVLGGTEPGDHERIGTRLAQLVPGYDPGISIGRLVRNHAARLLHLENLLALKQSNANEV
ncbi:MAG TPA: YdcF family protein [Patescibacteria group bacterium]|nr:YdcF family protein [Patescibacteria group bacterium]